MDRYEARKAIVDDLEARGLSRQGRGLLPQRRHLLPLPQRRGAHLLRAVVREDAARSRRRPSASSRTARSSSCPTASPRPTSTGCTTSATGASPASSGGATASRPGTATTAATSPSPREDATECEACHSKNIEQDPDVLDTWFSSALWPFSTLGWPEETEDLKYFYPTDVLVTGYDIIFFWVARMIFSACEQMHKIPFHTVLIHGLIRDPQGKKMSQVRGQRRGPHRDDRPLRRRRAALQHHHRQQPRQRHALLRRALRGHAQLRQQALERQPLCHDEPHDRATAPCRRSWSCPTSGCSRKLNTPRRRGAREPRHATSSASPRRRYTTSSGTATATGISS